MILTVIFAIIGLLLGIALLIVQFIPDAWSLVAVSLVMPQIITRTLVLVLGLALVSGATMMILKNDFGRMIINGALSVFSLITLYAAFSWIGIFEVQFEPMLFFGILYFLLVIQIVLINGLKPIREFLRPTT